MALQPNGGLNMGWLITKYLITAGLVVLVSEVAKRSDKLGGLMAALPIVTLITLVWLHLESQPLDKIANHARYTLWYVLPTLPMFVVFPLLLARVGFWPALGLGVLITLVCFVALGWLLRGWGIELW